MAKLDFTLAIAFSAIALIGLLSAALCLRKALRVSGERDGDFKMFLWALGAMVGLIVAGMSAAYILLPIFFTHSSM
ncbi:MAG: hypothetical protein HY961_07175 [Ignavibacteriae bacterium]|nr:hypothetical protein [Ignavibacteriota bacterium]